MADQGSTHLERRHAWKFSISYRVPQYPSNEGPDQGRTSRSPTRGPIRCKAGAQLAGLQNCCFRGLYSLHVGLGFFINRHNMGPQRILSIVSPATTMPMQNTPSQEPAPNSPQTSSPQRKVLRGVSSLKSSCCSGCCYGCFSLGLLA